MDIIIWLYCAVAGVLWVFGINCHLMTRLYRRTHKALRAADALDLARFYGQEAVPAVPEDAGGIVALLDDPAVAAKLPVVTTQLPIYNERAVASRVIRAVAAFAYPEGKHHIQVLDDSTDDTRQVVDATVAELKARGADIEIIRRTVRTGYKAGALREALPHANGEFVAIFDADFAPHSDFLLRTIPYLAQDPKLGFVQTRWDHLNRDESLMTRMVSVGIDGHFLIEQTARCAGGYLMNFNGTCGVFRAAAIYDAGNWQDDTLTEDLDLSYRMQMRGWGRRFLPEVTAPGEVPADMNAFKQQQFRWAKGSIQTARKLLPQVLAHPMRPHARFEAVLHLTHYLVHPMMAFLAAAALPIIVVRGAHPADGSYLLMGVFLVLASTGPSAMYVQAQKDLGRSPYRAMVLMPLMICFGCGLAVNNTRAVAEALLGRNSPFVRTPKRGSGGAGYRVPLSGVTLLEAFAGLWCISGVAAYWLTDHVLVGYFQLLYAVGFLSAAGLSWKHGRLGKRGRT